MAELLKAMLLDIPEVLETARLELRGARAGQGAEATAALAEFARDRLGARRIEITSDARNAASRRVAEKCGFALEGVRRQARRANDGALADACMYARTF